MARTLLGSGDYVFGSGGLLFAASDTYAAYGAGSSRALVLDAAQQQYAQLTLPGKATGLEAASFEIELRVKFVATPSGGVYVLHRGNLGDEFALIAGFAGTALTFWSFNDNAAGGVVSVTVGELGVGVYHVVKVVYANGILTTFLDGVQTNAASIAAPRAEDGRPLTIGRMERAGATGYYAPLAIDWLRITRTSQLIVNAAFDEASGAALNTGTAGGSFLLYHAPLREAA